MYFKDFGFRNGYSEQFFVIECDKHFHKANPGVNFG